MTLWSEPSFFLLFVVLGLSAVWLFLRRKKKDRVTIKVSAVADLKAGRRGLRSHLAHIPLIFKIIGLGFVIVALARPQRMDVKESRDVEGVDIVIALDVSDSMLIEDMVPENRLESAKLTIKSFIEGRRSDRIGLIVFSGESYTRVPLTLDYENLLHNLATVKTSSNIKMGTAIGVSMANAVSRLKESTAKSRVVILLTDGESNTGTIDPMTALKIAIGYGIRIYTIGVGKDGQAQLPRYQKDQLGRMVKTYQPIHSKVNEELLGQYAEQTGGRYYRAIKTKNLEGFFQEIDQLEKSKIDVSQWTKYVELFRDYLVWAITVFVGSMMLSEFVLRRGP